MREAVLTSGPATAFLTDWRRGLDWPILFAACLLLGVGLLMSLAAGPPAAARLGYEDSFFFVKRQAVFSLLALGVLVSTSLLERVWSRRLAALVFAGAFVLLVYILMAGHEAKGAQRWIRLAGLSLQPSEFAKPALLVLAAWLLAQRHLFQEGPWTSLTLGLFCATVGLFLLQPDVGQSVLLTFAFSATFFVAGVGWRLALSFLAAGAGLVGVLYATLPHVRFRLNSFINPAAYDTYQVDTAREAIARGGLVGVGPGEGRIKTALPDAHTDFIYAVLGEEFGYLAALALICVFAFITWRGLKQAARLRDPYPRAAATGLFALFGLQAAINIGVNVGLIPPKGMTLPLVSYGGSSLIGTALTLGLALALIRRARPAWKERL
ncbi:MAG: FtsW/RodA/SpoVE family cell cycle protein [Henriciella sp.]